MPDVRRREVKRTDMTTCELYRCNSQHFHQQRFNQALSITQLTQLTKLPIDGIGNHQNLLKYSKISQFSIAFAFLCLNSCFNIVHFLNDVKIKGVAIGNVIQLIIVLNIQK